jgi:hypothetical protein
VGVPGGAARPPPRKIFVKFRVPTLVKEEGPAASEESNALPLRCS